MTRETGVRFSDGEFLLLGSNSWWCISLVWCSFAEAIIKVFKKNNKKYITDASSACKVIMRVHDNSYLCVMHGSYFRTIAAFVTIANSMKSHLIKMLNESFQNKYNYNFTQPILSSCHLGMNFRFLQCFSLLTFLIFKFLLFFYVQVPPPQMTSLSGLLAGVS